MKKSIGIHHGKAGIALFFLLAFAMLVGSGMFATDTNAFQRYNDGCDLCHGTFTSNVSPKGTNFGAAGNKHDMHRSTSYMGTACNLCHTSSDGRDPYLGSSDGVTGIPGVGCAGCHNGPGLRQHHRVTGASTCSGCHPSTETAPAESTKPPYYGTSGTKANNACNPTKTANLNENWSVDSIFEGLDNDGNNLYDSADPACAAAPAKPLRRIDFDSDAKTDITVWRPSTGQWWLLRSSNGTNTIQQWGMSSDVLVAGDYDGDGKTDFAVWRPSTGVWWVKNSVTGAETGGRQWGVSGDVPVPGDYDGDGKTDFALWRPSTGTWWIINSSTGAVTIRQWGVSSDTPVAKDYDGDGKTDIAVWRPSSGIWFIINSSTGAVTQRQWGASGDIPVPGDYDGDGKSDIAVWRPSSGIWFTINSSNGVVAQRQWGASGDVPVKILY